MLLNVIYTTASAQAVVSPHLPNSAACVSASSAALFCAACLLLLLPLQCRQASWRVNSCRWQLTAAYCSKEDNSTGSA
jgi:hypothetical protein